jgi:hypothetical protein
MRQAKHARRKAHCRLAGRAASRGLRSRPSKAVRISSERARASLNDKYEIIAPNSNRNSNRIISSRDHRAILYRLPNEVHGVSVERGYSERNLTDRARLARSDHDEKFHCPAGDVCMEVVSFSPRAPWNTGSARRRHSKDLHSKGAFNFQSSLSSSSARAV